MHSISCVCNLQLSGPQLACEFPEEQIVKGLCAISNFIVASSLVLGAWYSTLYLVASSLLQTPTSQPAVAASPSYICNLLHLLQHFVSHDFKFYFLLLSCSMPCMACCPCTQTHRHTHLNACMYTDTRHTDT